MTTENELKLLREIVRLQHRQLYAITEGIMSHVFDQCAKKDADRSWIKVDELLARFDADEREQKGEATDGKNTS